jgi:hypothetical protein
MKVEEETKMKMKLKKKVCRCYIDGVRMAWDVLKMALGEYKLLDEMKADLVQRYHGHDVKIVLSAEEYAGVVRMAESVRNHPLRFAFKGDGKERSCMAWTVDKRTGEKVEGPVVSVEMARAEGWYDKAGSKWRTMPDVMLRYRAASFFSRAYCPDLTGGFHSVEEARDAGQDEEKMASRSSTTSLEAELLGQSQKEVTPVKQGESPLAPINEEMLNFNDVPVGQQKSALSVANVAGGTWPRRRGFIGRRIPRRGRYSPITC